ncbi:MAG: hypothetical protein BWY70_00759 [Bacteroidetes bacterium ADurb.Bin408]|nr:MAG: hypothetical protein BWY70_00759 [Bacteroidetes bacterium ADurb.Bin408]
MYLHCFLQDLRCRHKERRLVYLHLLHHRIIRMCSRVKRYSLHGMPPLQVPHRLLTQFTFTMALHGTITVQVPIFITTTLYLKPEVVPYAGQVCSGMCTLPTHMEVTIQPLGILHLTLNFQVLRPITVLHPQQAARVQARTALPLPRPNTMRSAPLRVIRIISAHAIQAWVVAPILPGILT